MSPFQQLFALYSSYRRFASSLSPRVDARCRGERHAAFWPARSCSKTSLTCAACSVHPSTSIRIGSLIVLKANLSHRHFGTDRFRFLAPRGLSAIDRLVPLGWPLGPEACSKTHDPARSMLDRGSRLGKGCLEFWRIYDWFWTLAAAWR